jgi:hypothetical protein
VEPPPSRMGLTGMISATAFPARFTFCALAYVALLAPVAASAEELSGAQRRGAEEYLAAVSSGSWEAVAYAIHPKELEEFRLRILSALREEARQGESAKRNRMFGPAMPLNEIERMTPLTFFTSLARKFPISGRRYEKVKEIGMVPGADGAIHAIVRGIQPEERGEVQIAEMVTLTAYGKDWKAKVPDRLEALIDDLANGRRQAAAPANANAAAGTAAPAAPAVKEIPPGVMELLNAAEKSLAEGNCADYYKEKMSKNFRRVTSKQSIEALINSCKNSMATREMLLSTVRIAKEMTPRVEYEGQRVVYDFSGQGLPYERFVLEQIDKKWYVAE